MPNKKPHRLTSKQTKMITDALALHQSGQLELAENLYKKVLRRLPRNALLLKKLGTISIQKGRSAEAIVFFEKSLQINPDQSDALNNLGLALQNLQRWDEALINYDKAIFLSPDNPDAHSNRGISLHNLHRWDEALISYDKAISLNPDDAVAYYNRGDTLRLLKRQEEAVESYDRAIALNPNFVEALSNRGVALTDVKRLEAAVKSYDRAIALNPNFAEVYSNRGNALRKLKRQEEAVESYDRAIALNPNFVDAYSNRGVALKNLNRLDEALESYDRAIALNPNYAGAYSNRGNALTDLKRLDEALESYDCAIALNPDYAEAYSNRGNALTELKRLDEALESYDRAIALNPDYANAYWNKSLLKILQGDYLEGWKLYEWRWKREKHINSAREFHQPLWLGNESISDETLLIHPEQGHGDYIQFIRYAALVERLGVRVVLEVPPELTKLFSTLTGQLTLIEKGKPLPSFDYHCPVMSLPLALKTTLKTIPAQIPYLYTDDEKRKRWNTKLGAKTVTRVGLVWSGSTTHENDHNRSLLLEQVTSLLELPMEFHSLQKEIREIDLKTLNDFPKIHQHQNDLLDFSDTAALIDEMDLVISVDTAVAHLSGAMGKKTFILLPYSPDYRWMLDRVDSPWYPTVTLFRQPAIGDWDSVISEIRQFLSD